MATKRSPKPTMPTPAALDPAETTPLEGALAPEQGLQTGEFLTTAQGLRLPDTDHSLKAGPRGPSLLEDFHLREKITHFDHERIPERVVHARGAAAHGVFRAYGSAASVTKAGFLAETGKETPVFVRFSTVLGSRGSADTVRDTRGFAVKFYTDEGNVDLVGNNMPVFFIQDGIKFPDIIHAGKPHPDREIPQAQSRARHVLGLRLAAHRGHPPRHVGRCPTAASRARTGRWRASASTPSAWSTPRAATSLVKFHWKPVAGRALPGLGGGADRRGRRPGLPPPRHGRRDRRRRVPRVRAGHPGDAGQRRRDLRGHRPARPHEDRARGAGAGAADRRS